MVTRADLADSAEPNFLIAVGDIVVPSDRLRSLKPADVAAIAVALDADGQYDAIAVAQLPGRADFILVDGLHRLAAARSLGWGMIEARIVGASADERRRREILSEFVRASSDVFDRAAQIKALATMARLDPHLIRPEGPREIVDSTMIVLVLKWDDLTAETLGVSRQTIYNHLRVAETFDETWVARLRTLGHATELVPLLLLAKQETRIIAKVIAWLEAAGVDAAPRLSIAEAIAGVTGATKPTPADKRFSAVIGNLGRMGEGERATVVDRVVAQYLTTERLEAILATRRKDEPSDVETLPDRVRRTAEAST